MGFEPDEQEFCLIHGYEHMKKHSVFDKFEYCVKCAEEERTGPQCPDCGDLTGTSGPCPVCGWER